VGGKLLSSYIPRSTSLHNIDLKKQSLLFIRHNSPAAHVKILSITPLAQLTRRFSQAVFPERLSAGLNLYHFSSQASSVSQRAPPRSANMPPMMSVTFLGTSSGGGPIDSRNCSSLVMDVLGDGTLWMVDCAEGTMRQFTQQPCRYGDKFYRRVAKINKIFITHMHADHTMGLITLLRTALGFPKLEADSSASGRPIVYPAPKIEIYGPQGIRQFVRSILAVTHSRSADKYAAHELLMNGEEPSAPITGTEREPLHSSEVPGRDLRCDEDGFWRGIAEERMGQGDSYCKVVVDAGPIIHRDMCLGFVVREILPEPTTTPASRTLVVLGDTSDPSGMKPLIAEPVRVFAPAVSATAPSSTAAALAAATISDDTTSSIAATTAVASSTVPSKVSLLIHECTDAHIPTRIDTKGRTGKNRQPNTVHTKAVEKGHSIPAMAGSFANAIGAEKLVLNHIGSRFPAPPPPNHSYSEWHKFQQACINEIERQAWETFKPPSSSSRSFQSKPVIAAWDFLTVEIPPYQPEPDHAEQVIRDRVHGNTSGFGGDSTHGTRQADNHDRGDHHKSRRGREHSGGNTYGGPQKKPRK